MLSVKRKIIQKIYFVIALAVAFVVVSSVQQPQTAAAFSNKKDGMRLLNEYKSDCKYYRAGGRPDRTAQDRRCNKVRRALLRDANCHFTDNRDSEIAACQRKIENKFAPAHHEEAGGGDDSGPANDPALDCVKHPEKCDLVKKYVNPFIAFLSAGVGIAVTIGIISGGIRYAGAGDDPQKINMAKKQIGGAIVALLAYIFLYLLLKWFVPGL